MLSEKLAEANSKCLFSVRLQHSEGRPIREDCDAAQFPGK